MLLALWDWCFIILCMGLISIFSMSTATRSVYELGTAFSFSLWHICERCLISTCAGVQWCLSSQGSVPVHVIIPNPLLLPSYCFGVCVCACVWAHKSSLFIVYQVTLATRSFVHPEHLMIDGQFSQRLSRFSLQLHLVQHMVVFRVPWQPVCSVIREFTSWMGVKYSY